MPHVMLQLVQPDLENIKERYLSGKPFLKTRQYVASISQDFPKMYISSIKGCTLLICLYMFTTVTHINKHKYTMYLYVNH